VLEREGAIDVLVNNAGVGLAGALSMSRSIAREPCSRRTSSGPRG
jgi:NAD(P)-dependent dehydrogenase (short-subunit alcohol dehydrogenase family)